MTRQSKSIEQISKDQTYLELMLMLCLMVEFSLIQLKINV